jgi:hypothetical protein
MRSSFIIACAGAGALAFAAAALAHHIPVALSTAYGEQVLSTITYFDTPTHVGVPAYRLGGDAHSIALGDGSSFTVVDHHGAAQTVTFAAAQFADIAHAEPDEVAAAINAQLPTATAFVENNSITLRGNEGGAGASLTFTDGAGAPLAALGLQPGTVNGSGDIDLVLSVPAPHHDEDGEPEAPHLEHHPYLVVLSTTAGATPVGGGHVLPFAVDAITDLGLRATNLGLLPGFAGTLDHNADGTARIPGSLLDKLFPNGKPDALFAAYAVFSTDLTGIEMVSNRFEVVFVD